MQHASKSKNMLQVTIVFLKLLFIIWVSLGTKGSHWPPSDINLHHAEADHTTAEVVEEFVDKEMHRSR